MVPGEVAGACICGCVRVFCVFVCVFIFFDDGITASPWPKYGCTPLRVLLLHYKDHFVLVEKGNCMPVLVVRSMTEAARLRPEYLRDEMPRQ